MRRSLLVSLIPMLILSSILATTSPIMPIHASLVGVVCIAADGSTACPPDPPVLVPATPSTTQLRVAVAINSSSALSGFDIIMKADHTVLQPADAIPGTVVGSSPTIIVKCIGGALKQGSNCASQAFSADTIELAVAGSLSSPPTTGLLLTAVYNIVGLTSNTPIGFQTGCTNTSTSGICVTIATGSSLNDQETIQAGQFSNQAYYSIDASPVSMIVSAAFPNSSLITLTSLNNFAGTINLASASSVQGLTSSVSPTSVTLAASGQGFTGLSVSVSPSVQQGNYTVTVTATSGTLTNSIVLPIKVLTADFTMSANPGSLVANASASGPVTGKFNITLSSIVGLVGTVSVTAATPHGLSATLSRPTVKLNSDSSNNTILTVSANNTGTITVTAVNATLSHSIQVTFYLRDFTIGINHDVFMIPQNSTSCAMCTATVTIASPPANVGANFEGTVNMTSSISVISGGTSTSSSGGVKVDCASQRINVPRGSGPVQTTCGLTGLIPGTYNFIVTGTSGSYPVHSAAAAVQVLGPDFAILPNATIQTTTIGTNATFILTIQDLLNLKGVGTFSAGVSPLGPAAFLVPSSVTLTGSANATIVLTVSTNSTTPVGPYTVIVTGTIVVSPTLSITHTRSLLVVATAVPHPPQVLITSVSATPLSTTVGHRITYSIVVLNNGTSTQQMTVEALVGDTVVNSTKVTLAAGQSQTVSLSWNTGSYNPGSYILGGKIIAVPGQVDTGYNLARIGTPLVLNAQGSSNLPVEDTLTIALVLVAIAAVVAVVLYLRGRRSATPKA